MQVTQELKSALLEIVKDAFVEGFISKQTYNDTVLNTSSDEFLMEKNGYIKAIDQLLDSAPTSVVKSKLEAYVVVSSGNVPNLPVVPDTYYTGASGRFTSDIRRAKMYPTEKAAKASYPFTQAKRYNSTRSSSLTTLKVTLEY